MVGCVVEGQTFSQGEWGSKPVLPGVYARGNK